MSYIQSSTSNVVTDSASAASTFSSRPFNGRLLGIGYSPTGGSSALSTACGATFTAEVSGVKLMSLSPFNSTIETLYEPRSAIHTTAGATAAGFDKFPLVDERIRIDVSSGGAAKTATFRFYVE